MRSPLLVILSTLLLPSGWALESFPPSGLAADDHVYVVPVEVESVSTAPVGITFRIHKTTYALDVYRKSPDSTLWGAVRTTIPAGTTAWTDTTVAVGTPYEYRFHALGVPSAWDSTNVRTYVLAGIDVDRTSSRGRVVLVMPSSIQTPLASEIARFKRDLIGDGWTVHDVITPDGRTDWSCAQDGHHVQIRDDIRTIYNAHPGEVKHVILLGRVPQPRSGQRVYYRPDGHGDLGAVAADMYYADVDNTWTDTMTLSSPGTVDNRWQNVPGDGRFDQSHFRHLTQAFEMGWGRIDFRGAINGGDEIGALRNYLNKLHDYKHAQNGFVPGRRSIVRDAGGLYKNVQEEFFKTITPLSGLADLDHINGNDLPNSPGLPEAQYTFDNGPYLYIFMAGNEPNQPADNARAVFWTGFKSHVGYPDLTSWTRSRLAEPNGWTLSWTFAPPRGRYVYHRMALGGSMGDVMKATINNQSSSSGLYGSAVKNYINGAWTVQSPAGTTNDYGGFTFHGHMGDPTLRDQMMKSPDWVRGRLQNNGAQVAVEWLASPDATHGYDVYSAVSEFGPYTKRNVSPLHPNGTTGELAWTDTAPPFDPVFYMVRARKLEETPSGSYLNASVGRIVEVERSPAPFAIATTSLPNAYLESAYQFQLQSSGGNPPTAWSITGGSLPDGLSLSVSGIIFGIPTNAGSYSITVQTTDLQGAVQSVTLDLHVDMFFSWPLLPNGDLSTPPTYTGALNQNTHSNWHHPNPSTQWYYDAGNGWSATARDGANGAGAQPGIAYVIADGKTQSGAVAFRFAVKNTDGSGTPNRLDYSIYGINGNFSWNYWDAGSNPSGDATLLLIDSISGDFDWTNFKTSALQVGEGYDYYVIRFFPNNVETAQGDFMAIDNLAWSTAVPPPVFYDVTFSAGANGSLTGDLIQNVVSGGSTSAVTAVPAEGYELAQWTWTGGGSATSNPLVISGLSSDLTVTASFQPFNHPPISSITSPDDGSSFPKNTAITFGGTGSDVEDGPIGSATWTSSIDGAFHPTGGTYAGLSPGSHTITRTVTDSGGKTGSDNINITILEPVLRIATADVMVRGDGSNASTNFGSGTPIRTRTSELAEGLYRFDVSSVPGTLVSATLRFVLSNADGGAMNVRELTDNSWTELGVTYNSRPAHGNIIGQIQAPTAAAGTAMELDVTTYVSTQLASGVASFATTGTGSLVRVHSRESSTAANHPRLILVYTLGDPIPPPNTPLWMPSIFQNGMVLQRGQPIAIFGRANAGESINVTFGEQNKTTVADGMGDWTVYLDAETASVTGRTLTVQGASNTLTFTDVLVGEVWLLSGQSNMARSLAQSNTTTNAANDVAALEAQVNANSLRNIRMFRQNLVESETPADDVDGGVWSVVEASNLNAVRNFSGLGLYFGRKLHEDTGVPVGLVSAAWGARSIQRFIDAEYSQNDRHVKQLADADASSSRIYNKMIFPLAPYTMKGCLWYQGESNVSFAWIYYKQLTTMIVNWRELWGQDEFHFGIVQLSNWSADTSNLANLEQQWDLRQAQDYVDQVVEDTFLASFVDAELYGADPIHPPVKKVIGDRLAIRAMDEVYDLGDRPAHPRYAGHSISGNQVTVNFDQVGGGLSTTDAQPPSGFHVAGADRVWVAADAAIVGNTIVVSAAGVSNPVAVSYHTRDANGMNLYTNEGWPVLPFATDRWAPTTGWTPTRQEGATRAVLFYYPVDTQVFVKGDNIMLTADATINFNNTSLEMQQVEFFNGATKIGEATGSPAVFNWSGVPAGTYTITAKSKSSPDNIEQTSETVTITVADQDPFVAWATYFELTGDDADPLADFDGDGVPNLLEYASGGNPTIPDRAQLPALHSAEVGDNTHLTLTFSRVADPDLVYEVWGSNDLSDWGALPIWYSSGELNSEGEVTVTDSVNIADQPRRFLRLNVRRGFWEPSLPVSPP